MRAGLLWFDDEPGRDLDQKVGRAAQRYREKFGRLPEVCYVHPSTLQGAKGNGGDRTVVGKVRVVPLPSVLRHHFFLCQEDGNGRAGETRPGSGPSDAVEAAP